MTLKGLSIFAVLLASPSCPHRSWGRQAVTPDPICKPLPLRSLLSILASFSRLRLCHHLRSPRRRAQAAQSTNPSVTAFPVTTLSLISPLPIRRSAPESWPTPDRISWVANVVLAIVAYIGIILAISTLKKIERNTRATEALAEAAADSAQAALLNAQAVIDAGRPWLLITVETSRSVANSFAVKATNRGRCPANMITSMERIMIVPDESHLPSTPEYENQNTGAALVPIILLPGESTTIKSFSRDDLKGICENEELFKKVENWEEKVFIYGKVLYRDLIEPADKQIHETSWCCWYIHGRQKSGLVIAGVAEYNLHT